MSAIWKVVAKFIRLAKRDIHPDAVLVAADDVFEVKRTPSILPQGPALTEYEFCIHGRGIGSSRPPIIG